MSSRRRERVGGGYTARATAPDDPAPHATTPPPIRSSRTEAPLTLLLRAQSANPQQRGQISASRGFGRATTAGARSSGSRHGGKKVQREYELLCVCRDDILHFPDAILHC